MNDQFNQPLQPDSLSQSIYEDVARPNTEEEKPQSSFWAKVLNFAKIVLAFILTTLSVYIILTAPAYYAKAKYYFTHRGQQTQTELVSEQQKGKVVLLEEVQESSTQTIQNQNEPNKQKLTLADLENNHLIIPKIDVKAPIIWNSDIEEKTMLENLRNGLVHYGLTPLPDAGKGPVFITGHSSYYWWDKGQYKTIFANLDQLTEGDEVALAYDDIVYVYKVYEKKTVNPEEIEVLKEVNEPILRLMTCVPVGTNLRRLIVSARQITPTQSLTQTQEQIKKEVPVKTPVQLDTRDNFYLLPWIP